MKFTDLNLPEPLLRAVEDLGWDEPTPVQAMALPHLLDGRDVAGQAQTGTGKTACFLLATMTQLLDSERPEDGRPRALVVAPTRELAIQIAEDAVALGRHTDLVVTLCYGGTDWEKQKRRLDEGADIVVGTPGRLIDYYKRKALILNRIETVVIDEADRMFDMGFVQDITYLLRSCPPKTKRQSLLFSATLSQNVMTLAWRYMNDPVEVEIEPENLVVDAIDQALYHVPEHEKLSLLLGLLKKENPQRAIVFVNTKRMGERLTWKLNHNGYQAVYMSGDLPQKKRAKIIDATKAGKVDLLVATDVASRGIHVDDLSHVFNYDIPQDPEDYVHRIGRTARAGARGRAITLACERFVYGLAAIEKYIKRKVPVEWAEDGDFSEDRSGRFTARKGKTYTGWPPAGVKEERDASEAARGTEGDVDGADKPKRKRRRRRNKSGDGATTESATQTAEAQLTEGDEAGEAAPVEAVEVEAAEGEEKPKRKRRRRRRRKKPEGEVAAEAVEAVAGDAAEDGEASVEHAPEADAAQEAAGEAAPEADAAKEAAPASGEAKPGRRKKRQRQRRRLGDGLGLADSGSA